MANETFAMGKITLDGEWTEEMAELINKYLKITSTWHYCIRDEHSSDVDNAKEFSAENRCIEFSGIGRWSFRSTLEDFFIANMDTNSPLFKLMEKHDATITFDYVEDSNNDEWLADATMTIASDGSKFEIEYEASDEYEYNEENLEKLGLN